MATVTDTAIDIYCERTSPAFWAEPVNALTNASFILAAVALVVLMRRAGVRGRVTAWFLIANVAVIGIGSFLFHTYANRTTLWADVVPIFIYQLAFVALYARNVAGFGPVAVAGTIGLFIAVTVGFGMLPREWLNGSLAYAGALVFIAAIAAYHCATHKRERWILWLAAGVFLVSLGFRSIDLLACGWSALGTHFLWHLLNGVVLYLTTRAYLLNQATSR